MSAPVDQPARDKVRTDLSSTLFVEAGAGTGKTTALVDRVVHAVATGHLGSMARLAAITFTENAAAELRTRIREALELGAVRGKDREHNYDAAQRALLRSALEQIDDAAITTLHGFAARILQDVPIEAGLPPGFAVNDAIRAQLEATARWRTFLDELLDDESVAPQVLAALTLELRTDKLREVADAFAGSWDALQHRPFMERPLPAVDLAPVLVPLRRAASCASAAPDGDRMTEHLRDVVVPAIDELMSLTDDMDRIEALQRLQLRPGSGNKSAFAAAGLDKDEIKADLEEAVEARKGILTAVGTAAAETLCARLQDYTLAEVDRRRREGSLTFHDLLVLTRDVLRSDASVRRRLHERYPVVLIDEFQDTDPLQVEIACLIAGSLEQAPGRWDEIDIVRGGLFFVGDPKQSIYRFRRADVQLYQAAGKRFAAGGTTLQVNFRSVPAIVDAANFVFGDLIGLGKPGQVDYRDLLPHRPDAGRGACVRVIGGPLDAKADELRENEAAHLADIAVRAKVEKWQIGDGDGQRDASYRDVAILLPTRTSLPAIEAALQERDVPYRIESRSLVWATDAVRDVVTLLQALATPADEVAVVAALRHAGLACSDIDLVEWAAGGGRWTYLTDPPSGLAETPVGRAMATLRGYHDMRWWLPVNELVERIVRELRLVELTAELRRPRDHWRRLRFVVDQARAFCDAGGHGLGEFVQWATDQIESEADVLETVVPESDDDAVRILTVHGSKGLEFPITVVAGLGTPLRTETTILWGGPRPEVRFKGDWLATDGFSDRQPADKLLSDAEAVRLLYVAMTRAEDHLVLGCYHKPVAKPGAYGSHAQQLWRLLGNGSRALVEPEPTGSELASPAPAPTEWVLPDDSLAEIEAAHARLLADVSARVATTPTGLAAQAADEPRLDDAAESDSSEPDSPAPPRRRMPSRRGAAIGTAVHGVLEVVDLQGLDEAEFRRLAEVLAGEEEISPLAADVTERALAAARAPMVRAAVEAGAYWREVYLVVRDGDRVLEGYIDLLVRDDDRKLVVVDYKTDRAQTSSDLDSKTAHYRPQLAAYGRAVASVAQEPVSRGALVFAHADAAQQVDVPLDDH